MSQSPTNYHVFETANGFAAIACRGAEVVGFRLPAPTAREAERAVLRRLPDALAGEPPEDIAAIVGAARRYFAGERIEFGEVPVGLGAPEPFHARVYEAVRRLGWGETTTYGALARQLGAGPEAARDVGQAMARNPVPLIIPCHRVLAAGGKVGGFSAPGGSTAKARMLALEGVAAAPEPRREPPAQGAFGFA